MTIDKESLRPAFERWCVAEADAVRTDFHKDDLGTYWHEDVERLWRGWCAAFESLGEPVGYQSEVTGRLLAFPDHLGRGDATIPLYRLPEVKP